MHIHGLKITKLAKGSEFGRIIIDNLRLDQEIPSGVAETLNENQPDFTLYPNYPNPFNPETLISFHSGQKKADISLRIYNILGHQIRLLAKANFSAGRHDFVWDGRDEHGQQVSSGIYIYEIESGSFKSARRMLLMK